MEQPNSNTPLDYQSRTGHKSRGQLVRWCLVAVAIVAFGYAIVLARNAYKSMLVGRQIAAWVAAERVAQETYVAPPNTLRYSEWPEDLVGPEVVSARFKASDSDEIRTRSRVTFSDSGPLARAAGRTLSSGPTRHAGSILWTHLMHTAKGRQGLVGVMPDQFLKDLREPAFSFEVANEDVPLDHFGQIYRRIQLAPISGPPGWNSEPVRIYAGQPIPGDKSRFTCKLETPTQIGRLEGQLVDSEYGEGFELNLTVHLDGPNPNPPTSQPTTPSTAPSTAPFAP
jgi:hypothetical protein